MAKKWLLLWVKTICEINEAKIGEKIDSNKLPSAAVNLPKTKQLKYNVARYSKILPHHVLYILSKCLSTRSNNHNTSGVWTVNGHPMTRWIRVMFQIRGTENPWPGFITDQPEPNLFFESVHLIWAKDGSKHKFCAERLRIQPAIHSSVFLEIVSATHLAKDLQAQNTRANLITAVLLVRVMLHFYCISAYEPCPNYVSILILWFIIWRLPAIK